MAQSVPGLYRTLVDSNNVPFLKDGTRFGIVNDALRQGLSMGWFLRGRDMKKTLSNSWKLKGRVMLERESTFKPYNPGRPEQFPNVQPGTNHESHWSYYHTKIAWTAVELMQGAPEGGSRKAMEAHLLGVRDQKDMDAYTAILEGFDDLLWAQPNYDLMENVESLTANEGGFPAFLSIPAWLNEEPDGLYAGYNETEDFTSIHQVRPSRYPAWVPGQFAYNNDDAAFADPTVAERLLEMLVTCARNLHFRAPDMYEGHFEKEAVSSDFLVITGQAGRRRVDSAFAQNGDNFITLGPREMSYGARTVEGIPIREHIPLDDYQLYNDGSGGMATQADAEASGPRFYFINKQYYDIKFYADRYFKRGEVQNIPGTDEAWAQDIKVWCQAWPTSRRRHGIVYPMAPEV